MKKTLLRTAFVATLLLCVTFFQSSCSKDDDPKPLTKTDMISRVWIQVDLIASGAGMTESIFDQEVPAEHQDDLFEFKSDGTFVVTEGATRENPADPDTVATGTWQFTDNETKITIDPDNDVPTTLTIEELTTTSLKGYYIDSSLGFDIKITSILQPN